MHILLCESAKTTNTYIEHLSGAYEKSDCHVVFGVENFLFSNFLPDMVHIQWPEAIYRWRFELQNNEKTLKFIEKRLCFYSNNKIPIVYTVHNLLPHENPSSFDKKIYTLFLKYSDVIVHHGDKSISLLKKEFPVCEDSCHIIAPHGPYPFIKSSQEESRVKYALPKSECILLNFGKQRVNKGADFIKTVINSWNNPNAHLFTIGSKNYKNHIKGPLATIRIAMKKRVDFLSSKFSRRSTEIFKHVEEVEIPQIMAASDIVFLGHHAGLNSGLLSLAATYKKPVVFPDIGNFKEQLKGWDWYECYKVGDINSAVAALERMYKRLKREENCVSSFDNANWRKENSWEKHVKNILKSVKNI